MYYRNIFSLQDVCIYVVHFLKCRHLQHSRHNSFHHPEETQAGKVLQRDDSVNGAGRPTLPRSHHLRRYRLRVQAQQLQHGAHTRRHVGRGADCDTRGGRPYQDPGHIIENVEFVSFLSADKSIPSERSSILKFCNSDQLLNP